MGCCVKERVEKELPMKVLGGLLILFSVIELAIGGTAFGWIKNMYYGAWWAAVFTGFAGISGALSLNGNMVVVGAVFAVGGAIACVIGIIVDGMASSVFSAETGCINTNTLQVWGTSNGIYEAALCADPTYYYGSYSKQSSYVPKIQSKAELFNEYYFNNYYYKYHFYSYYYKHHFQNNYYYNQNHNYNYYYYNHNYFENNYNYYYSSRMTNQCVCYGSDNCYGYDLATGNDCGSILTTYSNLLISSTVFLIVLMLVAFAYAFSACSSMTKTPYNTTAAHLPTVQEVQLTSQNPEFFEPFQPEHGSASGLGPIVYLSAPAYSGMTSAASVSHQAESVPVSRNSMEPSEDDEMRVSIDTGSRII